jgi:hypothetical protein
MTLKKLCLFLFIQLTLHSTFAQIIIQEGRGIDSLTLGIKEAKVTSMLGNKFQRKSVTKEDYMLTYSEKFISVVFDKDSIVYEIIIDPFADFQTSKGLQIKRQMALADVEKVYGNDWWTAEGYEEAGFDVGIRFELKNDMVSKIIIEESDLDEGNDYSFYEYIDGTYIPKNLADCFDQLNTMLDPKYIEIIKNKSESDFSGSEHFNLGIWMRNNWGLWKGSRLYQFFKEKGLSHPDDMSGTILISYHRKLNNRDIELEKQIKRYQDYWKKKKD